MYKAVILSLCLLVAQAAHASSVGQSMPMPTGPYPETGTFCGFMKLCDGSATRQRVSR